MSSQRRLITVLALSALLPSAAMAETVGLASWYGDKHDGRRTSSGEIFDQEGFTAASRSIPLGSRVRVTSQDTGQSVVVTVNDRMGGHASVIDLSKGAAREIGLLGRGRGTVSIAAANRTHRWRLPRRRRTRPRTCRLPTRDVVGDVCAAAADRPWRTVGAVTRRL